MPENCFICKEEVADDQKPVGARGRYSLINASKIREDWDSKKYLEDPNQIVRVHIPCQVNYGNEKLARAAHRKSQNLPSSLTEQPGTAAQVNCSEDFNFQACCFICGKTVVVTERVKVEHRYKYSTKIVSSSSAIKVFLATVLKESDDPESSKTLSRIQDVDLAAVKAKYHLACYEKLRIRKRKNSRASRQETWTFSEPGRPRSGTIDDGMNIIYSYMMDHSDECQFSLSFLLTLIPDENRPCVKTMKARLNEYFGHDMIIFESAGLGAVCCFKNTGHKILSDAWYSSRNANKEEERLRVVSEAAAIVLEDIRSRVYKTDVYPGVEVFLDGLDDVIPQSLQVFLQQIIMKHKRVNLKPWQKKITSIAHVIISATRPRSFVSPLMVGLGGFLKKKFGSRSLIDVLSSLGFCASYSEVETFENSAIMLPEPTVSQNAFSQFVFDNADFNTNTISGHGTFHVMGGIRCVTPEGAVQYPTEIPRSTERLTASQICDVGQISIQSYDTEEVIGLNSICVCDPKAVLDCTRNAELTPLQLLWLYGKWACLSPVPGWNGFMQHALKHKSFEMSNITFLPFINAPASDYNTIYTCLLYASSKSRNLGQSTSIVTFDQPLYWKARDIVGAASNMSDLSHTVVRLGGFHLMMSFLASIGNIMSGSGLEDVLKLIYAENTVKHILSGHAYSRAMRAHMLVHLSLGKIIFDSADITETLDVGELDKYFGSEDEESSMSTSTYEDSPCQRKLAEFFERELDQLKQNGPTAQLWLQYFKMVTLLKLFVEAERSGNWNLHLSTVKHMLPFFHSAGRVHYAKSAHLYFQDMASLSDKMPPEEFKSFTEDGHFTIRRTNKFWSGIPSDQTIEQTLMRSSKVQGGLFQHGRGSSASITTKWTLSMLTLGEVCEQVEKFCDVRFQTSEQHVDCRQSRVERDNSDVEKIDFWLAAHPPFAVGPEIRSISTGIIGDSSINCYRAEDIGTAALTSATGNGQTFGSMKCKQSNKVNPLSNMAVTIKTKESKDILNPLLLFQRMCFSNPNDNELELYLSYELAPFPTSLFSGDEMRKNTKSDLYQSFSTLPSNNINFGRRYSCVIDGGFLLHKVVWDRNANFNEICARYVRYVDKHFHSSETVVIFDGYQLDHQYSGTKAAERHRRSKFHHSADAQFNPNMTPATSQDIFLASDFNKARLIELLMKELETHGILVDQAFEDADTLIVETAIKRSKTFDSVTIVGEDVDLLVILTGRAQRESNIYFRKPGRKSTPDQIYSPNSFKYDDGVKTNILFLHAMSGCDTTSALFKQGKKKFISTLGKSEVLQNSVSVFKESQADPHNLASVGMSFLIAVYGGDHLKEKNLDALRFKAFARSLKNKKTDLSSLPPTTGTATQHCLRVYLQVQQWMGFTLEPTDWGWKRSSQGLEPVKTHKDLIPSTLLNLVSCGCKKNCGTACGCRKAGLNCSAMCKHCAGKTCSNADYPATDSDDEDFDTDEELPSQVVGSFFNKINGNNIEIEDEPARPKKKKI